jgi:serine phosphatase RsbU (regulator of sigma subunit)
MERSLSKSPQLPGFEYAGCNQGCTRPTHELGARRIADRTLALWMMHSPDANLRAAVRQHLEQRLDTDDPAIILNDLNHAACGLQVPGRCDAVEIGLMIVRAFDHTLAVAAAGDFFPVLRTREGGILEFDRQKAGVPLGVLAGAEYEAQAVEFELNLDAFCVAPYTKQIMNPSGALYTRTRLHEQFAMAPEIPAAVVQFISEDIRQFIGSCRKSEDICMVCIRRVD